MTAHIVYAALDDRRPATLSPPVLQGLLRGELGFDGLILTDCLEMAAIAARYAPEDYAVAAVEAGADLLLISHTYERQRAARDALAGAIRRGGLGRERVLASVQRVLAAKERLGLYQRASASPDLEKMRPRHARLEAAVAERAVTLVKNDGIIPLPRGGGRRILVVWPVHAPRPRVGDPATYCPLGQAIKTLLPGGGGAPPAHRTRRGGHPGRSRPGGRERSRHRRHHHRPAGAERGPDQVGPRLAGPG